MKRTGLSETESPAQDYAFGDFFKTFHLLITGGTDEERLACLNALLLLQLCRSSPDELRVLLLDPEGELGAYSGVPHLPVEPITDREQIFAAMIQQIVEMEKRYERIEELNRDGRCVHCLQDYNNVASVKLPRIVVVLNERDGRLTEDAQFAELFQRLVQKCRASGIWMIFATNRASDNTNFVTHIIFPDSATAGEEEYDESDRFDEFGRLIFRSRGAHLSPQELQAALDFIKERYGAHSDLAPSDFGKGRVKDKVFGMISLGCDKNRVDGERLLGEIAAHGCTITDDPAQAQILIVNTCAFLNEARKEAIDTILSANRYRTEGKLEKLVVTGCLPQKFIGDLFPELTEGDVFLGVSDCSELFPALERAYAGERINAVGRGDGKRGRRVVSTAPHFKYLKIADGCFNHCTYCLIPKIRGKYVSYPMEELVEEARALGETQELILVAQDVTRYGEDSGENRLVPLLKTLSALENIHHIRLLYCYPEAITDELIAEVRDNPKILKYLDIPMQHCEDRILERMGRRSRKWELVSLISKLRSEIPEIALRTTFIAGFPSETEEEHRLLLAFLRDMKFENCGFFAYSREPETPAYRMGGQLFSSTKNQWVWELYETQAKISAQKLKQWEGKTLPVLVDGHEEIGYIGRAYFQAPEIDGNVFFVSPKRSVSAGEVVTVKIQTSETYDLEGIIEE